MDVENWCQYDGDIPEENACPALPLSALCELGWRHVLLSGLIRNLLILHFSQESSIEYPNLRRYIWQNTIRTGILIETVHRWRADLVEKRPAILVGRNGMASQRLAVNDLSGRTEQGDDEHSVLWVGSHTVFCIDGTGAGSDVLASEVQRELTQFGPAIRNSFGLMKFQVLELGAVSEIEESTENYVTPVTVGWAYTENWRLSAEALPLKRVPISFLL